MLVRQPAATAPAWVSPWQRGRLAGHRPRKRAVAANGRIKVANILHDPGLIRSLREEIAGNEVLRHEAILAMTNAVVQLVVRAQRQGGVERSGSVDSAQPGTREEAICHQVAGEATHS